MLPSRNLWLERLPVSLKTYEPPDTQTADRWTRLSYHRWNGGQKTYKSSYNYLQIKAWITTENVHADLGHCRIIYQSTPCEIIIVPQKNWPAQKTKHFELGIGAVLS